MMSVVISMVDGFVSPSSQIYSAHSTIERYPVIVPPKSLHSLTEKEQDQQQKQQRQ